VIDAVREFAFPNAANDRFIEPEAMVRIGVPPLQIEILKSIAKDALRRNGSDI